MRIIRFQTTWGTITLTLDDRGRAVALDLPPMIEAPRRTFAFMVGTGMRASRPRFRTLEEWVKRIPAVEIPAGTEFQRAVWSELKKIPRGEIRTYGEIASAVGCPNAARAVGSACGANPLPVFIPCHRVVAKQGLGGFSSGLPWKRLLLAQEDIEPSALSAKRLA